MEGMGMQNEKVDTESSRVKRLFDITVRMGELMLTNGGEIYRAHETMTYMAKHFGLRKFQTFIIANGIFSSIDAGGEVYSCQIRELPLLPIELSRVEAVNELSREIVAGKCAEEEIPGRLAAISKMRSAGPIRKILAAGVGSACFCYLYKGSFLDSAVAFVVGMIMYFWRLHLFKKMQLPRMIVTILSSATAALLSYTAYQIGLGNSLNYMIIGSIFTLVPGVALTNAVRNLLENDYLSGVIRLFDALITATGIAVGVGVILNIASFGGRAIH